MKACIDGWYSYSSKLKIFFNNGYYDFKKMQFINNVDNVETLDNINRGYYDCSVKDENKVYNLIFWTYFRWRNEEVLLFSRALAGEVND